MGCWDVFCPLCGLPLNAYIQENITMPAWLYNCSLLLNNNKYIHNSRENSCNVEFIANNNIYSGLTSPYSFIAIHTVYLKFINKEKNIKLRYSDLPINTKLYNQKNYKSFVFDIDYKPTSNYWGQEFNINNYIADGYTLQKPLKNNKLGKFIINIFNKLKIKTDSSGPLISATLYNENNLLIGSDNKIWIINKNKWQKTNDLEKYKYSTNIKITKNNIVLLRDITNFFQYNFIDMLRYKKFKLFNIPRIGQVSRCGILLKDIKIKQTKKLFNIQFIILHTKNNLLLNDMIKTNFDLLENTPPNIFI